MRIKLEGHTQNGAILTKQEEQECVYYSQRGIMEICRWSRQPKANLFMDWVWDIVEKYRNSELPTQNKELSDNKSAVAIDNMNTTLSLLNDRLTN